MTNFVSWRTELNRFKDAMANRDIASFWIMSTENSREMKIVYTRLENIQKFIEWLEMKAAMEEADEASGSILLSVGGGE